MKGSLFIILLMWSNGVNIARCDTLYHIVLYCDDDLQIIIIIIIMVISKCYFSGELIALS